MAITWIKNYLQNLFPEEEEYIYDPASKKRKASGDASNIPHNKFRRLLPLWNNDLFPSNLPHSALNGKHIRKTNVPDIDINIYSPRKDRPICKELSTSNSRSSQDDIDKMNLSDKKSRFKPIHSSTMGRRRSPKNNMNSTMNSSKISTYFTPPSFNFTRKEYDSLLNATIFNTAHNSPNPYYFGASNNSSAKVLNFDTNNTSMDNKLLTKDRIMQIINTFEIANEVIDCDLNGIEDLPRPPSPKPDIKVEPINSLKTMVDTVEVTKPQWLSESLRKREENLLKYQKEIDLFTSNSNELNAINHDLLYQSLARKVEESLSIKSTILPIIEAAEDELKETILPKLTTEQIDIIRRAFQGSSTQTVTKKFNLNLNKIDLRTLSGLEWLNDNIINFYMNLIIERSEENDQLPKTYATNTFFYPKLIQTGPASLKRWTRKIDIFAHRFICVPIHLGIHWCMAIIDLKLKTIKYYDSMGRPNDRCLEALKAYLEFEHQDKKGEPFSTEDFKLENVKEIPQQANGSDCGMFACTFAEYVTRNAALTFTQKDMPYLREKCLVEILTGKLLINT